MVVGFSMEGLVGKAALRTISRDKFAMAYGMINWAHYNYRLAH